AERAAGEDPMNQMLDRRAFLAWTAAAGAVLTDFRRRTALAAPRLITVSPNVLTVAIAGDMPMTSIKDGKLIGTDGEMIVAIAERLSLDVKPSLMEWSATLESVRTSRADIVVGNMKWAPARARVLSITDAIYFGGTYVTMKKDNPLDRISVGDLK